MDLLKPLVALLAIVNPIGVLPFFISFTQNFTPEQRRRTIRISSRPDPTEIAAATTADTSAATPYTDLGGINDTDPDPAGRQKP